MNDCKIIEYDNVYHGLNELFNCLNYSNISSNEMNKECPFSYIVKTCQIHCPDALKHVHVAFKLESSHYRADALQDKLYERYKYVTDIRVTVEDENVVLMMSLSSLFTVQSELFTRLYSILENRQEAYASDDERYDDIYITFIKVLHTNVMDKFATVCLISKSSEGRVALLKRVTSIAPCCIASLGPDSLIITASRIEWERIVNMAKYTSCFKNPLQKHWPDFLRKSPLTISEEAVTTSNIDAGLTFDVALPVCINGALIARTSWPSGDMVKYVPAGNYFKQCKSQNTQIPAMFIRMHEKAPDEVWLPNTDDLTAHDWIAYDSVK